MRSVTTAIVGAMMAAAVSMPALAGNGAPSGAHFNLNIIGVEKGKTTTMTGSERHTIFVALGSRNLGVESRIYLTQTPPETDPNDYFKVCDGNGFDAAHDCAGATVGGGNNGAVFQLPCNLNLPATTAEITLVPCDETGQNAFYEVWARALGSPKGNPSVSITTCATEVGDIDLDLLPGEELCSTESVLLVRNKGKSTFTNVTTELTSICVDTDLIVEQNLCDVRYALFRDEFVDWFWKILNGGVRLVQVRFYVLGGA